MIPELRRFIALYTDLYQLTMAQGYFFNNKHNTKVIFDYFFRTIPFDGNFVVFAGLQELLKTIEQFEFTPEAIDYLSSLKLFKKEFLKFLAELRFTGNIYSVYEGEIVFPYEPVLKVEANLVEAQLLETYILNWLNFSSLIATKARRIKYAAGNTIVADFGLRRAQGMSGTHYARSAFIGGIKATSNLLTGFKYNIPVVGTMAHSWIMSFNSEYEAFQKYVELYPQNSILLIDTYDTLKSGLPNAIRIAKELEKKGFKLKGVRIDSGNLLNLSIVVRNELNKHNLKYVKIVASDSLDEYKIHSLLQEGAKIDLWGVGTNLATAKNSPALNGVYKLAMINNKPTIKISDNPKKTTLPGNKTILRKIQNNKFSHDIIALQSEISNYSDYEVILHKVMEKGRSLYNKSLNEIYDFAEERFGMLPDSLKNIYKAEKPYPVIVSDKLKTLKNELINKK